jgi:drug/metabolite transporter (DMT)-like permease
VTGLLARHGRAIGVLTMVGVSTSAGGGLVLANLAYDGGTNTVTLQLVRFTLVIAALSAYVTWKRQSWRLSGKVLALALALGVLQGFSSFTYVGSLRYIPTSLAVIIVFTYPSLVSLLAHLAGDERLSRRRGAALALSFAGLAIAFELSLKGLDLLGVGMAVAASVSFAVTLVWSGRLMKRTSAVAVWFHMGIVNLVLLATIGVLGRSLAWPVTNLGWIGMFGMALAFTFGFIGFGAALYLIGPSLSAILNNLEPVVAVVLSILVLREPFGPWQVIGGSLVMAGVMLAR